MRILLALVLLLPIVVQAQTSEVTGVVRDAQTGETLPSATVQIQGTLTGTITNEQGEFALNVPQRPATLTVRYIGYQMASVRVEVGQVTADLSLEPSALVAGELEVTDEDPGMRIMRRVIEEKAEWQAGMSSYAADAYTRIVLRGDSGIVTIAEIASDLYWRREGGTREVIKAQRQTANAPFEGAIPAASTMLNLYGDEQEVAGYALIGVTHPKALSVYRFRLVGQRSRDGQRVFDISVEPRSPLAVAYVGQVSVLETDFAIIEARLKPGPAFRWPPPFKRFEVEYVQQFDTFGGEAWVPVDLRSETVVEIGVGPLFSIPPFQASRVSRLTDYRINAATPDSLYESRRLAIVDSAQVEADTLLDSSGLRVPLEPEEVIAYAEIDSTDSLEDAFKPSGALSRMGDDDQSDGTWRGHVLEYGRLAYNRVEGLRLGYEPSFKVSDKVRVGGGAAYSTGAEAFSWAAGVTYRPTRTWWIRARHSDGIEPRYSSDLRTQTLDAASVFVGGNDFYDYEQSRNTRVSVSHWFEDTQFSVYLAGLQERNRPIATLSDLYTLYGSPDLRENPAVQVQTLRSATLGADWGTEGLLGVMSFNRVQAAVEFSPDGISNQSFVRAYTTVDTYIPTWGQRRLFPAQLVLRATAQVGPSDLPLARYGIVESAGTYTSPWGSLRTRQGRPYQGYATAAVFAEHNFRTMLWEIIGWRWAADKGYNFLLTGAAATTWSEQPVESTDLHTEAGFSLSGLFDFLRLDVTFRLDEPGFGVGIALPRVF